MITFTSVCSTELCCQVYLPWLRAVAHPFRMCIVVGCGQEQRGHLGLVCILHLRRLSGVGRQSAPALNRKLNCPAGRPKWILFHTWQSVSRATTSLNLDWTARVSRWVSQYEAWWAWIRCLVTFFNCDAGFTNGRCPIESRADCNMSNEGGGIDIGKFCVERLCDNSESSGFREVEIAWR